MRLKRFTHQHARDAGYAPRRGAEMEGEKGFSQTYTGKKLRRHGHTLPLVYSGETKAATEHVRVDVVSAVVTGEGEAGTVRLEYPKAIGFRRRPTGSDVNMLEEFTKLLATEERELADVIDDSIKPQHQMFPRSYRRNV
ncbi:hypothetical protein [Roseiconus lacunae]|uniref:hypothetical protein n=1 Tax=Roseiconus lacunae TaxID=2605694 RepID=UPI00135C6E7F|nr:hypothetical protein [Roseiconus lacunae]